MSDNFHYPYNSGMLAELKEAAFEYLLTNPGTEFPDFQHDLVANYPTEVTDAYGDDPEEVYARLSDLWETEYHDPKTGIEQTFSEWALTFANDYAVGIYYYLIEAMADRPKT